MSETKYISVIHVPTDKIVTAFKFENDATWIGKEKEELIATANYCEPRKKVKMIFVKSYERKDKKKIASYFRAAPNQIGLKENMAGESNKHKKCKENIYQGIYSGEIKINGDKIDKDKIEDIYIEYRTAKNGYVIPDVLIKFKEEDIRYGLGIFIEIQLSKQYNDETITRTYSRAIEGFSGIWLWEDDFDEDSELINNNLEIKLYRKLLLELNDKIENDFINRINKYGNIIDKKLINFKKEVWDYFNSTYKSFKIEYKDFSKEIEDTLQNKKIEIGNIKNIINEIECLKDGEIAAKIIRSTIIKESEKTLEEYDIIIKNKIKSIIDNNIKKISQLCPKCGKPMKIGKAMSGYNWYCIDFPIKCDGLIKDVNFNED